MEYIVIDRATDTDITDKVLVIKNSTDDYYFCRKQADKLLAAADKFWNEEIQSRYDKIIASSMDDFGEMFDADRGGKWVAYVDGLKAEIAELNREYSAMMDNAGDWEDKEYGARVNKLINFLAARDTNPLRYKEFKQQCFRLYTEEMGVPNMGKYIAS